jgi:hypothetical protein
MSTTYTYTFKKPKTFKERWRLAWRILRYGEAVHAPQPWYDGLYPIVSNEYSHFAEMAVDKSEHEAEQGLARSVKRREAIEWMRTYAREAGKDGDIQEWVANFLIEWWVARRKGRF